MKSQNPHPTDYAPATYEPATLYHNPSSPASLSYPAFYPQPSDSYAKNAHSSPLPDPLEDPLTALTDGFQTRHTDGLLNSFLTGRKAHTGKSVEDILGLIHERESLKYDNLHKIDYDSAQTKTRLFEIDSWRTGINPQIDKTRAQIDRELLAFEREKRFEQVACWRDTTRLKSELRDALQEFGQEKRKEAFLQGYEV